MKNITLIEQGESNGIGGIFVTIDKKSDVAILRVSKVEGKKVHVDDTIIPLDSFRKICEVI